MNRGMAMVLTLLVLAFALYAGWYSTRRIDYFPDSFASTFTLCEQPPGFGGPQPVQHEVIDEVLSEELAAFHEPSLYRRPKGSLRSVRFTWLPSFHDPMVVRVDTLPDGRQQLTAKQRPGGVGFSLNEGLQAAREQVRILTSAEANRLEAALLESRLYELPDAGCSWGPDGAQWVVEASVPSLGYRYRDTQSPDSGVEHDLGLIFLGLTNWGIEPAY